jgi:enoyl-CoA hydratase/carnithine racemase
VPFTVSERDGLVVLTLDTPNAAVNIFNQATARQTSELMASIRPETARAVVIRSGKTGSFINGVGLVLSSLSRELDELLPWVQPLRDAYRSVRDCPVPVVAMVEGSCWGCGLEFLLNCHFRLAVDVRETEFRMSEIADYNCMCGLYATDNLPLQIGLPDAIDLLIQGDRWDARRALAHGLVHDVASPGAAGPALERLLAAIAAGEVRPATGRRVPFRPEWEAVVRDVRRRVDEMHPRYADVRRRALQLMETSARTGAPNPGLAELQAFVETAPAARGGFGFFHVRQAAAVQAAPPAEVLPDPITMEFAGDDAAVSRLREELLDRRPLSGLRIGGGRASGPCWRFAAAGCGAPGEFVGVTPEPTGDTDDSWAVLYLPAHETARRFVELWESRPGTLRPLARFLQRAGIQVAMSHGSGGLGSGRLLGAYAAPLIAALGTGVPAASIASTLWGAGWIRMPWEIVALAAPDALVAAARPHLPDGCGAAAAAAALAELASPADRRGGHEVPALLDAIAVSLLAAARGNLSGGFRHPTIVDLAARELLDFPLLETSLCRHLTAARLERALRAGPSLRGLVAATDVEAAERFVAAGGRLYR